MRFSLVLGASHRAGPDQTTGLNRPSPTIAAGSAPSLAGTSKVTWPSFRNGQVMVFGFGGAAAADGAVARWCGGEVAGGGERGAIRHAAFAS